MGQAISATQFYLYGRRHFTSTGYTRHVKKYKSPVQTSPTIRLGQEGSDGVNMEGKVVVITGANSGIGKEMATYALAKGSKVYMICRSKDRAEAAKQEILQATSTSGDDSNNLQILLANTGELAQVRAAVQSLQAQETKVDVLICNAGALLNQRTETKEGIEVTFASHLLGGSYLISQLLLPQLQAANNPRVIFVTSGGMLTSKFPDWETATCTMKEDADKKYSGELSYAYAKRGQVLLAERLTETMPAIQWITAHPGWTATPAVDSAFGDNKKYLEPMRNMWQGAEGIAYLMGAPKDVIQSGAFYLDRTPQAKHIAGPFFSEGSFTKNTNAEVDEMMAKLKEMAGV
ncbi:daunorubicin C-13 ketoreductase DnrU [Seminavis robusta]|uniref:Daunorubicin C-13 ketoreductase DnrU n=1 Tax=Seminavis robusta TaxID=568900 RepID=A0A9N8HFJ2_9STRA|nr:daunorubicin C-13 ketoreductase DnrU [Seminavis robusta]|eukprot:Sro526_g160460.1 daunorubicin C-13 ketoreductase DnrU (347) ;mRNA; f:41641-42785